MAIAPLANPTNSAKISDLNALITAINTELDLLATKASVTANTAALTTLASRVAALEAKVIPPDLSNRVKALEDKPAPVIPPDLTSRVTALETEPDPVLPPDLTERVTALEIAISEFRTPPEATTPIIDQILSAPVRRERRSAEDGIELIYDKATIYYGDLELHAIRVAETTWRLLAQLNYITISQIIWTYDETVEGTPDEVYRHAAGRLMELAELKVSHDAAHDRVRRMSEGEP